MSFVGQVESDGKSIVNNMIVNTAGILLQQGHSGYAAQKLVKNLQHAAAGIVTTIE